MEVELSFCTDAHSEIRRPSESPFGVYAFTTRSR